MLLRVKLRRVLKEQVKESRMRENLTYVIDEGQLDKHCEASGLLYLKFYCKLFIKEY